MTSIQKRSLPGLDTLSQAATALSRSASNLFRVDPKPLPGLGPVGKLPEWKVMCQEAQELAKKGEKEEALMLYHKALRMRPNAPEIKNAIRNLTNNITESIQASKTMKLFSTMKLMAHRKKVELRKKLEEQEGMPLEQMNEETQLQFKKACAKAIILAKSNVALTVKEKDTPRPDSRSADWQQEAPEFLLESTQRLENSRPTSPGASPREYALAELKRIQTDFDEERYEKARYRSGLVVERVQESQVGETFTEVDRQNVVANLYSCQGNACLELGLMDDALDAHLKDLHIGEEYNLLDCKSRGLVNVGRVHARAGRFRDAIDVWGDKIALCVSSEERSWLFHEMGRCYYEMDEYADAQDMADKACVNAQETSDVDMQFKASYLLAQCYEQLQEIEEALIEYKKAHDLALVSDNEDELEKIQEAIQRLNEQLAAKIIDSRRRAKNSRRRVRLPVAMVEDEIDPLTARGIDVGDSKSTPTSELYYMTLLYVMSTLPEC